MKIYKMPIFDVTFLIRIIRDFEFLPRSLNIKLELSKFHYIYLLMSRIIVTTAHRKIEDWWRCGQHVTRQVKDTIGAERNEKSQRRYVPKMGKSCDISDFDKLQKLTFLKRRSWTVIHVVMVWEWKESKRRWNNDKMLIKERGGRRLAFTEKEDRLHAIFGRPDFRVQCWRRNRCFGEHRSAHPANHHSCLTSSPMAMAFSAG